MKTRAQALRAIQGQSFDVCVIGGGATGSACAWDAQLRGLRTVLLEAADFASGTSSTSTKMAHGGVRYLEEAVRSLDIKQYEVVRRALRERVHMLRSAPFLAHPQAFLTPCFNWLECAYYEIGLKLYDWIAGSASLAPSFFVSREDALRRIPQLAPRGLAGGVIYSDGQFDDARYNIVLVETFTQEGGEALNYARVQAFVKQAGGKIAAVEVEDQLSPERFEVQARAFVNATGPFADGIRAMAAPGIPPRMRPSKGAHIFLPLKVLNSDDALLIPKTEDGRVIFAIPWLGRLLVGTTEEEVRPGDELCVTREDVDYLLRHLNRYLAAPARADQIVSGTAGARPLVSFSSSKATKKLARDHVVERDSSSGLISILGGKWTTHRVMAENTINAVAAQLGHPQSPCRTRGRPLAGANGYSESSWQNLMRENSIMEATARHLAEKYGARAPDVLALAKSDPSLTEPLVEGLAPLKAQVAFAAREEMAMSIEDVLARRIGLQWYGWKQAMKAAPLVADLLARELSWPGEEKRKAAVDYETKIQGAMQNAGLGTAPDLKS
ncbi:MAG TPA: FAD-dependent oxidoreductase [Candidatus Limnocylindrales bacterium]|nr:FAD-dependent oxidoreductase [Candidatus Limnocylindrales bacterium]